MRLRSGALALLLAGSALLRVALVWRGGQGYWPDENRYFKGWGLLIAAVRGEPREALQWIFESPDHTAFTLVGAALASLQGLALAAVGEATNETRLGETTWVAALVLQAASVAAVAGVYAVARRAGAGAREAGVAAFLAACSNTLFYWSRHLQPYDLAIAIDLGALWLALERRTETRRSLGCGLLAGLGFLTYNRYWASAALVGAVHVWAGSGPGERARRAVAFGAALCAPVLALTALSLALGEPPFVARMAALLELTSVEADFQEGWWVPFAYLWETERGLLLLWLLGVAAAAGQARGRDLATRRRAGLWLACTAGLYATFVLFSNGLELIGVLGRQVRQLVPFLCLAAAVPLAAGARALARRPGGRLGIGLALVAVAGQAAWNFATPLGQEFPDGFRRRVGRVYGDVPREVSVLGPRLRRPAYAGVLPDDPPPELASRPVVPGLRLLNAQHLYPVHGAGAAPPGRVLLRARHPLQYPPNQYEGYRPEERAVLRAHDISLRLVERAPGGAGPAQPPRR